MEISTFRYKNVNNSCTPHFTGNIAEKAFSLVGGDGVFKNVTKIDFENFKAYVSSMRFKMHVSADDVAALSKLEGNDFIENTYRFLTKKIGLPEPLCPPIYYAEIKNEAILGYQPMANSIVIDQNKLNNFSVTKENIFGLLRHELQHTLQYYAILRHEQLGPKAVDTAGDVFAKQFEFCINGLLKNHSIEEVEQYALSLNDKMTYDAVQFLKKGDNEGFANLLKTASAQVKAQVSNLREALLSYFVPIKNDSALTPKLSKFLDEFFELTYYKDDYGISMSKYLETSIEDDAMLAQMRANFEFSQKGCFIKYSRNQFYDVLDNGEAEKFLNSIKSDKSIR